MSGTEWKLHVCHFERSREIWPTIVRVLPFETRFLRYVLLRITPVAMTTSGLSFFSEKSMCFLAESSMGRDILFFAQRPANVTFCPPGALLYWQGAGEGVPDRRETMVRLNRFLIIAAACACLAPGCRKKPPISPEALHRAAEKGNVEWIQKLISEGADVNHRDRNERTPLHWAALSGHLEATKLLLAAGADVDAGDDDGDTPLYFAAGRGHKNVVILLLASGAEADAKDKHGYRPLHTASSRGQAETAA